MSIPCIWEIPTKSDDNEDKGSRVLIFRPYEDEGTPENAVDNKNLVLQKPLDLQESPFWSLVFFYLDSLSRPFGLFIFPEWTVDHFIELWRRATVVHLPETTTLYVRSSVPIST